MEPIDAATPEDQLDKFFIESLRVDDIEGAMSVIEKNPQAFTSADLEKAYRDIQKSLGEYERVLKYFVMKNISGGIIGVIGYGEEEAQKDVYYLGWFAVDQTLQGYGLGKALLKTAEDDVVKGNKARL